MDVGLIAADANRQYSILSDNCVSIRRSFYLPTFQRCCREGCAKRDIGTLREAAPHHQGSRWRVSGSCEITSELRDLGELGEGSRRKSFVVYEATQDGALFVRKCSSWVRLWCGAADHRHPEHAPAQDAEHRNQLHEAFGCPQAGLLAAAARLV